jgi:predicted ester cyclase
MPSVTQSVVHRWFDEVWNQRREQTIDELIGEESICYTGGEPLRGPVEFKNRQYYPLISAFPNVQIVIEDTIERGEDVVVRWVAKGRHEGEGIGCRATGECIEFHGMSWIKVREGKMVEGWQSSNIAEVLQKLHQQSVPA